ncbi:DsbA family protein [Paenibacillus pini]|uniref:Periplasmic thiol:disulfide interchange protein DsbA n=1 Tax=Paenibacillus pini JCM 16418 TaxID=1236976 RepID=W7YYA5_9BACL|nr:thioredoxin domain-containing protein [Paenibacillus pini]GAF09601.1 periplasmic thiol:disulfide interchange protein DsbA [Paenibacillus pini JCM 16418]
MKPKKKQANSVARRKEQQAAQEKRMKRIMWITGASIVVLVLLFVFIRPQGEKTAEDSKDMFNYSTLPVLGNPEAPVKLVEFGDFKCPTCRAFSQSISPEIQKDYIDTGKVAMYFMNFLVISPDGDSNTAALAAQSVFHQNKDEYWKFNKALYDNQQDEATVWATPEFLVDLARKENIKVDYDLLSKDIKDKTYQNEVNEHDTVANKLNVMSTPSLFINGNKVSDQDILNYDSIKSTIDKALAAQNK